MILKNTFKYKRAERYTKIKFMIIKFMLHRSYILHFRDRMVQVSKSHHPIPHIWQMRPNNLNIRNGIIFFAAFNGTLLQKTLCKCAIGPKTFKE
jgi:hypothetical protein